MGKNRWLFVLILMLAVLVLLSRTAHKVSSAPNQAQSTAAATTIATESAVQPSKGPAYRLIERQGSIKHPWYPADSFFTIRYMQIDGSGKAATKFNSIVGKIVDDLFNRFQENAVQYPPSGDTQFIGASLSLDFRLHLWSDDLLSAQLYGILRLNGTVNPGIYTYAINYSLSKGRELDLTDLFVPDTDYLYFIASEVLTELNRQNLKLSYEADLTAGRTTIRHWNLSEMGLLVTFDQSEIIGTGRINLPEITIPYGRLRRFIKGDGPLGIFIRYGKD